MAASIYFAMDDFAHRFSLLIVAVGGVGGCGRVGLVSATPYTAVDGIDGATGGGDGATEAGTDSGSNDGGAPLEFILICPISRESDVGANTAIVVQASAAIDGATANPASLHATIGGAPLAGDASFAGRDLKFSPAASFAPNVVALATLAPNVRDRFRQPMAPIGSTWSFVTGHAATPASGFDSSTPLTRPEASHVIRLALKMDRERPILAWSASASVVATTSLADGGFTAPVTVRVARGFEAFEELSRRAAEGMAPFRMRDAESTRRISITAAPPTSRTQAAMRMIPQSSRHDPKKDAVASSQSEGTSA
jgi:hypothetical protein